MFSRLLLTALSSVLLFSATPAAATVFDPRDSPAQGTISQPANGTNILPGAAFDFEYTPRGDYCLLSHNYTVWVLASPPASVLAGTASGYFFGRFSSASSVNTDPSNPAPAQLTMPDFSASTGFSDGATAVAQPMYFTVLEEWNSCDPVLGSNFSLAVNTIIYNGTNPAS
ncbi:hypothetical protein M0805_000648 [Coniferiporia weirii]|nr:hypothetical protein M0805_000648 [Coniferiporia weirii]